MAMISVLIITKNSSETISSCIKSVKDIAGEILVIDGGSTDDTISISERAGAKVLKNRFKNFSDQRNLAASVAKYNWLFYIDSDEAATPEFLKELNEKVEAADDNTAGFYIHRRTFFLGQDWGFSDRIQRVFKKEKLKEWKGVVHETPVVDGLLGDIKSPVFHYTHRNLENMVDKTNEWSEYEANLRFKSNHPKMTSWRFFRVMMTGFLKSYFGEGGWKNGTAGVVESVFQAFSMFITYAKLWEKQKEDTRN